MTPYPFSIDRSWGNPVFVTLASGKEYLLYTDRHGDIRIDDAKGETIRDGITSEEKALAWIETQCWPDIPEIKPVKTEVRRLSAPEFLEAAE